MALYKDSVVVAVDLGKSNSVYIHNRVSSVMHYFVLSGLEEIIVGRICICCDFVPKVCAQCFWLFYNSAMKKVFVEFQAS